MRLAYLCLQDLASGTPANTHVHGIIGGLRAAGAEVDLFSLPDDLPALSPLRRLPAAIGLMLGVIGRLGRYDALIVRAHPVAWPVALMAKLMRRPVVQEVNGRTDDVLITHRRFRLLGPLILWLQHSQYRMARLIAAVTPGLATWAKEIAPKVPAVTVPNGVDTALFSPGQPRPADAPATPYAVMVSSFSRWHGIETLLAAVRYPAWPDELKVLLIGDGPERRRLAAKLDAEPRIIQLGARPLDQVPAYLGAAHCALILIESPAGRSDSGIAPLKLYEAMSAGAAVIATDQPYQRDVVAEARAGEVIPTNDPAAIAQAVTRVSPDAGARGRAYVVAHHDWQHRAADLLAAMQSLGR